jgi:hypothetical protein
VLEATAGPSDRAGFIEALDIGLSFIRPTNFSSGFGKK